jgi:hypothetical protein
MIKMKINKSVLLIIFLFFIVFTFTTSVNAVKLENYDIYYHKHTYNEGPACSYTPGGKCPNAWKTTISVGVGGTNNELKKYSHGRVKLNGKVISQKWKYSSMKSYGSSFYGYNSNHFMIDARISGTKSLKDKTLKFEGYDKQKRKWVSLGSQKIKKSIYSRR